MCKEKLDAILDNEFSGAKWKNRGPHNLKAQLLNTTFYVPPLKQINKITPHHNLLFAFIRCCNFLHNSVRQQDSSLFLYHHHIYSDTSRKFARTLEVVSQGNQQMKYSHNILTMNSCGKKKEKKDILGTFLHDLRHWFEHIKNLKLDFSSQPSVSLPRTH